MPSPVRSGASGGPRLIDDLRAWDARFKAWQERPVTIAAADDPEIYDLLEEAARRKHDGWTV